MERIWMWLILETTSKPHQRAVGGVQGLPGPAGRGGSLAGPAGAEEQVAQAGVLTAAFVAYEASNAVSGALFLQERVAAAQRI